MSSWGILIALFGGWVLVTGKGRPYWELATKKGVVSSAS